MFIGHVRCSSESEYQSETSIRKHKQEINTVVQPERTDIIWVIVYVDSIAHAHQHFRLQGKHTPCGMKQTIFLTKFIGLLKLARSFCCWLFGFFHSI